MNTTPRIIEFFFDFGSPASFLAATQLPGIAAATGAELRWRPMLLGGVFKATGNASPVTVPAKGRWMQGDLERWARRYGIAFAQNPFFPINTLTLMRGAVGCQLHAPASFQRYVDTVYAAIWQQRKNMGDLAVVSAALAEAGLDAQAFAAWVAEPAVKAKLVADTEEAVERGVFGAPTCFIGDEMHFGQDRLEFVREAASRAG